MSTGSTIDVDLLIAQLKRDVAPAMSAAISREMFMRVGRNALLFNQIETVLKLLLPFVHPDGLIDRNARQKFRRKLRKKTFGHVAEKLVESVVPSDAAAFKKYVDAVVKHRNRLVHHFVDHRGACFSEGGARAAVQWLDEQHAFCEPMLKFCNDVLVACLYGMERLAESRGEKLAVPEWSSAGSVGER
jgi:hypothetical protein